MTTAIAIIQSALEELGVYAPGDTLTHADAQRGLAVLNDILDSWSNQSLAMYAQLAQSFTLVANDTQYTIGPTGADIAGTRPLRIIQAFLTDPQNNNYGIKVIEQYEWNQITNKLINGQIPQYLFYNPTFPNGTINVWPAPLLPWTVTIMSYLQFTAFTGLTQAVELPRGYVPALKSNLAVALAPFFGQSPQPVTVELASRYLADCKRTNTKDVPAVTDPGLMGPGYYNYRSDTFGWGGNWP